MPAEREVIVVPRQTHSPWLSPVIRYGDLVFTSGMVGRNPKTGEMVEGGAREQTHQTLENLRAALEAAGSSLELALKANCFVARFEDRPDFDAVYQEYFPTTPPVRTCTQAGRLGDGVLVEIDIIAGVRSNV